MARIRPFRGLRPQPTLADKIASLPYDVMSSAEARQMAAGNPLSFLRVIKPEIDLPEGTDVYAAEVYAKGGENLRRLESEGSLIRDPGPCLYLYRQRMGEHEQTGLVAGASVAEYRDNRIKKHEFTRPQKEDDRTRHVESLNAQCGPVFLTYHAVAAVDAKVVELTSIEPTYDFVAEDGNAHTLWVISDPAECDWLVEAFAAIPALYVADGHHRSAAASRVQATRQAANPEHDGSESYNDFLTVIFPHDQMQILDYNRTVKDLNGLEEAALLEAIGEKFDIAESSDGAPTGLGTFGMYLGGRWHLLSAKAGTFPAQDPVKSLDVAILQDNLLAPILAIGDPRKDERVDFVGGIRGRGELAKRVDSGLCAVAFALHPTSIEQLFLVADADQVMPPKSTWFEPKLRSGMITRPLD